MSYLTVIGIIYVVLGLAGCIRATSHGRFRVTWRWDRHSMHEIMIGSVYVIVDKILSHESISVTNAATASLLMA